VLGIETSTVFVRTTQRKSIKFGQQLLGLTPRKILYY